MLVGIIVFFFRVVVFGCKTYLARFDGQHGGGRVPICFFPQGMGWDLEEGGGIGGGDAYPGFPLRLRDNVRCCSSLDISA